MHLLQVIGGSSHLNREIRTMHTGLNILTVNIFGPQLEMYAYSG